MKTKSTIIYCSSFSLILIFFVSLIGCTNNDFENNNAETNLVETDQLRHEMALLIGQVLLDGNIRSHVIKTMQKFDPDETSVSLAFLVENEKGMKESEIKLFQESAPTRSTKNLFKAALYKEFNEMSSQLPLLNKKFKHSKTRVMFSSSDSEPEPGPSDLDIYEFFDIPDGYQLFLPWFDEIERDAYDEGGSEGQYEDEGGVELTEFYVTYVPEDELQTENFGYFYNNDGTVEFIERMTNDFLDENPVFVIAPIDRPIEDFIPTEDPLTEDSNNTNVTPPTNPPTYPDPVTTLLTTNVNHQNIKEEDILTTNMPKIRINGTKWMGFGGTHQKLTIVRATADGMPKIVDGRIEVDANTYKLDVKVKRKVVRKKQWITLNYEFDPDWNMSENTQRLFVFSRHHISAKAHVESSVKVGLKIENGAIVPTAEYTKTVKVDITFSNAKLRVNQELSRRQVLATIVGPGTTGRTYMEPETGINFNLKNASIMDYYFKHYLTKLSN